MNPPSMLIMAYLNGGISAAVACGADDWYELLVHCARTNDLNGAQLVLPKTAADAHNSLALREAVCHGHHTMVELLLPYSKPRVLRSLALVHAVAKDDLEMVKLLLPHSNAREQGSLALQRAVLMDNRGIAQLLWPHSNIGAVINAMRRLDERKSLIMRQRMEQWQQHFAIAAVAAVAAEGISAPKRKM